MGKKKTPGMFAVVFSHAVYVLGSLRSWKPLYLLAKNRAIPSSFWLIPAEWGREWMPQGQVCLSSVGGDSAPARFSAKHRDEVARPGSVCCRLEEARCGL